MRTQTYVDNTVNDLRYEIEYENCVKDKSNFFSKSNIAFLSWANIYFILGGIFFKICFSKSLKCCTGKIY